MNHTLQYQWFSVGQVKHLLLSGKVISWPLAYISLSPFGPDSWFLSPGMWDSKRQKDLSHPSSTTIEQRSGTPDSLGSRTPGLLLFTRAHQEHGSIMSKSPLAELEGLATLIGSLDPCCYQTFMKMFTVFPCPQYPELVLSLIIVSAYVSHIPELHSHQVYLWLWAPDRIWYQLVQFAVLRVMDANSKM